MIRPLAPHRQALLDQIEAILRGAAPMPVGTSAITAAIGRIPWASRCVCRGHVHVEHRTRQCRNYDVATLLARTVRAGRAERIQVPHGPGNGYGQDYWRWLGPATRTENLHGPA